ncbi:hypothetical protein QR98_0098990 [Sarcoptes scabiei]|uniref:Uncharacterized protein n=1 Tax=Sarcoptes scabiei TaxID=52283 RepID=A0A132AJY4_SARSC|nr:hypothetical protein QR98_0098990 [Sarcoptes scabiei]
MYSRANRTPAGEVHTPAPPTVVADDPPADPDPACSRARRWASKTLSPLNHACETDPPSGVAPDNCCETVPNRPPRKPVSENRSAPTDDWPVPCTARA